MREGEMNIGAIGPVKDKIIEILAYSFHSQECPK